MKIGDKINMWTLIGDIPETNDLYKKLGLFECDCGNAKKVVISNVKNGSSKCCGCKRGVALRTHYKCETPEYASWAHIKARCLSPSTAAYSRYGGRGIKICDRWKNSFKAFLSDMGKKPSQSHSIDRIDNNGSYCPENCRWATSYEQSNNRSCNISIAAYGVTENVSEWARILEVPVKRIYARLKSGNSHHSALFNPINRRRLASSLKRTR